MLDLYEIDVPDLDFLYYPTKGKNKPVGIYCPSCGCIKKNWLRPYDGKLKNIRKNIVGTYDGVILIRDEFREYLAKNCSSKLSFYQIFRNVYRLECDDLIIFDRTVEDGSGRQEYCETCGEHKIELYVGWHRIANSDQVGPWGLYFSDVKWGTCPDKSPILFAGGKLAHALAHDFPEVYLHKYKGLH